MWQQVIDDIVIVDSEEETSGGKLTSDTLAKIDEILYADIGKLQKMDKVDKVRNQHNQFLSLLLQVSSSFMSEVDKILSLGISGGEGPSSRKVNFVKFFKN